MNGAVDLPLGQPGLGFTAMSDARAGRRIASGVDVLGPLIRGDRETIHAVTCGEVRGRHRGNHRPQDLEVG